MDSSEKTGHRYRLGYRGDIEGLRAVAILLVVAAHARVSWLAGGFVGVDVFYVLSGYLITGLLVQEIHETGDLRFANFYARRLRRLMPALLLMVAIVCVLGRLLLPAGEQLGQATAAASALLWISNFNFAFSNLGYFAPGADSNLFLHTWSLGVEEQFYTVWPLLVVLAMGAWQGAKRRPSAGRLKWYFSVIFVLGLALSLYWTREAPQLAFYMMPSRAWQFALGALVFLAAGSPAFQMSGPTIGQKWLRAGGWLGLAMILLSSVLIDGSVPYPGTWALLPSIGAALVLAAGGGGAWSAGNVLAIRPMQAIGRVSYAWYLWHWPVLLLGATLVDTDSGWNRLALVVISLIAATLSYRFFELPVRRWRLPLTRPRMAVFGALALMVLAGSLALRWHNAAAARMNMPEELRYEMARMDAPIIYGMDCDEWYHSSRVRVCEFGDKDARHTAVAIGDSVALQWFPAYEYVFVKPGWRLLVITKSSCPMVDVPIFYPRIGREYTECTQWRQDALRTIARLKPDIVVVGSTSTTPYTQTEWIEGSGRVLRSLSNSANEVYVMRSTPTLPFDGPSCLAPRSSVYSALSERAQCTGPATTARSNDVYRWLRVAAAPFHNVHFVDMTSAICPANICHAEINGRIVFRDSQHLTASFANSLGPALGKVLNADKLDAGLSAKRPSRTTSVHVSSGQQWTKRDLF